MEKKTHPKFKRPNVGKCRPRLDDKWRRPRGMDNKQKREKESSGAVPKIGYGQHGVLKNRHPTGLYEVLVHNAKQLDEIKEKAVRIASGVGKRKREEISKKAKELGLAVLNDGKKRKPKREKPEGKKKKKQKKEGKKPEERPKEEPRKDEEKKPQAKEEMKKEPKKEEEMKPKPQKKEEGKENPKNEMEENAEPKGEEKKEEVKEAPENEETPKEESKPS